MKRMAYEVDPHFPVIDPESYIQDHGERYEKGTGLLLAQATELENNAKTERLRKTREFRDRILAIIAAQDQAALPSPMGTKKRRAGNVLIQKEEGANARLGE